MAIEKVRSMLTQTTLSVAMSFFAGIANLVVLFAYDAQLAIWGVGLAMLEVVIIGFISVYLARRNFELSIAQGQLDGLAFDLIKGIQQARIQGSLLASFFYGYIFTQIPGGFLSRLFGGKKVFGLVLKISKNKSNFGAGGDKPDGNPCCREWYPWG